MTTTPPLATWKDLCIDALDPEAQGRFWAGVTGLERVVDERHVHLDGPTPAHRIWVNEVDRPRTVKNRIHLDVYAASLADLVALGATVLEPAGATGFDWSVMADPEGNEFCAFLRAPDQLPDYRLHGLGIDCVDAARVATWWGDVLGVTPLHEDDQPEGDWWTLEGVASDDTMTLDFAPVPEPRQGPHRVHWDVVGDADALIAAGASPLWDTPGWRVLADPEGNEFCVFAPVGAPDPAAG